MGGRKPATFNRAVDVMRSAFSYWSNEGWCTGNPSLALRRRRVAPDRSRSLSRAEVEHLLTGKAPSLREQVLWTLLYESAARASEILALDVEDLDLTNRRAKVRRKGGAVDVIVWQTQTARLLPRLIRGRKSGPLFLTDRRGAVSTTPSGYERLSYRRCAELFTEATAREHGGPWTLHQLRHSALTHAEVSGIDLDVVQALLGHASLASTTVYLLFDSPLGHEARAPFSGTTRTNGCAITSTGRSQICCWTSSVRRTPSVSIRIIAWSRASSKPRARPFPVTSSRSVMNCPASVDGRVFAGVYRCRSSVYGCG